MPDLHALAVMIVAAGAFFLYTRSWIRMELVSLLLLGALVLLFHRFPLGEGGRGLTDTQLLQSFGHPALFAICCLMILGRGLTITGALEPLVRLLGRAFGWSRTLGLLLTLVLAAGASAFVNDTPVLVLMLPLLLSLSERGRYPATKSLMPVNFAILAGGMLTTIGTSTNLLVLSIATDLGMRPMGIFDYTGVAAFAFVVALPYLWLVAPRLLPESVDSPSTATRQYEARIRLGDDDVRLVGKSIADAGKALGRDLPVVAATRRGMELVPDGTFVFAPGDSILLRDTPQGLQELASALKVALFDRRGEGRFVPADGARVDMHLAEVVLRADSELVRSTLAETRFAEKHGVVVVGLNRGTEELLRGVRKLGSATLAAGDVLLVQGPGDRIDRLRESSELMLLDSRLQLPRSPMAPWALLIFAAVVALAAFGVLPVHVAAFLGVLAMLLRGCVRLEGLGRALSFEVILLVASSIALGQSLVATGAADWLARGLATVVDHLPAAGQLAAIMALAAVLTNFVSNSAAAAVGTPIAIATATQLGSPLEPFVLAILFGANLSYATPMAYQTNLLVMNAAGYRFRDFVRVGAPLVALMLLALSLLLVARYDL